MPTARTTSSRRSLLQVGTLGLTGATLPAALRADDVRTSSPRPRAKACLLIFLDGGCGDFFSVNEDAHFGGFFCSSYEIDVFCLIFEFQKSSLAGVILPTKIPLLWPRYNQEYFTIRVN